MLEIPGLKLILSKEAHLDKPWKVLQAAQIYPGYVYGRKYTEQMFPLNTSFIIIYMLEFQYYIALQQVKAKYQTQ